MPESEELSPESEPLSGVLQENVLTMLAFDTEAAKIIRRMIEPNLFESAVYRKIAERAIIYIDEFGKAPGNHLPDELEDVIEKSTARRAAWYDRVLRQMKASYKDMNRDYVLARLSKFVREQRIKAALVSAYKSAKGGKVEDAEVTLAKALKDRADVFDPGTRFWDPNEALRFFDEGLENHLPLGIEELDAGGIGPAPKELFTIIAPTGRGKSWFMGHVAKQAMKHRKKVVLVSLEMSAERLSQRFAQTYFSMAKRTEEGKNVRIPSFKKNRDGTLSGFKFRYVTRPGLDAENARRDLSRKIKRRSRRLPFIIKQFGPSTLTINGLTAYLDLLEQSLRFIPDILLIDYADLMAHDRQQLRTELELTYQQLRALAIERNIAVVTASQSNRVGGEAKHVGLQHTAEAIGKANISDNVITFNQTADEKAQGLARLFVAKGRNDVSGYSVLISQAYPIGQFCLESVRMPGSSYWDSLDLLDSEEK